MPYTRLTNDPNQMGDRPCIRHLRIAIATLVRMVSGSISNDEILPADPDLVRPDISEARHCVAEAFRERAISIVAPS